MIKRLRKRFIRITMLSVTIVMLLLSLIVNIANYISTDSDLTEMLDILCENQGTIPVRNNFGAEGKENTDGTDIAPIKKRDIQKTPFNQ